VEQVRSLVGAPLRGELTRAPHAVPVRAPAIDANLEAIGGVLSHVVRLALPLRHQTPRIVVSDAPDEPHDAGAPWTWTAAEVATTQGALLSWLIHLAAAANDVGGLEYCLSADSVHGEEHTIAGGIVNWVNPASGRSPLHVAAINGAVQSVRTLLEAGALVHLRDSLGHTALYYVSRTILIVSRGLGLTDVFRLRGKARMK
jgi:lysophospholipase